MMVLTSEVRTNDDFLDFLDFTGFQGGGGEGGGGKEGGREGRDPEGRRERKTRENREKTRKRSQKEGGKEAGREKRGERGRKQAKTHFKISIFAHFLEGGLSHLGQGGNLTCRGERDQGGRSLSRRRRLKKIIIAVKV